MPLPSRLSPHALDDLDDLDNGAAFVSDYDLTGCNPYSGCAEPSLTSQDLLNKVIMYSGTLTQPSWSPTLIGASP